MASVDRPSRDPDVTLPEVPATVKVEVWIQENVFSIHTPDNMSDIIKSNDKEFKSAIEYLQFWSERTNYPVRARIAAEALAKYILLNPEQIR